MCWDQIIWLKKLIKPPCIPLVSAPPLPCGLCGCLWPTNNPGKYLDLETLWEALEPWFATRGWSTLGCQEILWCMQTWFTGKNSEISARNPIVLETFWPVMVFQSALGTELSAQLTDPLGILLCLHQPQLCPLPLPPWTMVSLWPGLGMGQQSVPASRVARTHRPKALYAQWLSMLSGYVCCIEAEPGLSQSPMWA